MGGILVCPHLLGMIYNGWENGVIGSMENYFSYILK
jgi:hypothetical protein